MAARDQFGVEPSILHFLSVLCRKNGEMLGFFFDLWKFKTCSVCAFSVPSTHWPGNGIRAIYSHPGVVYVSRNFNDHSNSFRFWLR